MKTRRHVLTLAAAALAAPAIPKFARAQAWPSRGPIRVIIPFSAGSTVDVIGRIVLDPLSQRLGQTMVIENRGGAGGSIGSAAVAKADPDGYTLLVNASAHSAAPAVYPNLSYDPSGDFAAVVPFGSVPNVIVISPAKGIKTVKELAEKAKASGQMTFSSAGVGSATHWAAERFRVAAGFQGTHVPFRGGPEALTEVMTGRVDWCAIGITSGLPFIKQNTLIPLAVCSPQRTPALADVPTTLEAGFADSDYIFWNGLLAPAKTPPDVVNRLREETIKVLDTAEVKAKFAPQGIDPMPMSSADFGALIKKEIESNKKVAQAAGLKFN
ncbi:MAG: tripartite tricarboxylate transporter substrate binding protein [Pseudolabrys sp.]|nr:tripartite tricarboxylate transporter substrate binding protein [Pseudolabrys sp.]MBV9956033.1 tripartite tricarboxylate transporter substrate binding protein [Pseudolabrys sp.]